MSHLPVIVGFGGVNPAGRSSFHQGYKRLVADALLVQQQDAVLETYVDLAMLMDLVKYKNGAYEINGEVVTALQIFERFSALINDNTLIRKIQTSYFDVDATDRNQMVELSADHAPLVFEMKTSNLPFTIPDTWQVCSVDTQTSKVEISESTHVLLPSTRDMIIKSAGMLPSGLDLSKRYQSKSHPKGLQMTVYGASDAIQSMGIDWDSILARVAPDQISVYASSAMGQLDDNGYGGMMGNRLKGKKVSSKHLALGLDRKSVV